jgi:hypothetical protein
MRIEWREWYGNIHPPALMQVKKAKITERLQGYRVSSGEIAGGRAPG